MPPEPAPSPREFAFHLNGQTISVKDAPPERTLLDHIRELGLTGSKEGCAEGECGACTVVLVKENGRGCEYRPVNSCLMLLPMVAGQEVYTVEALAAKGELHPVQRSMIEHGGSQCGYCTPGFVMSLFAEYYRPGRSGACDPAALGGNLCRCTGYRPIADAARSLGPAADDSFRERLELPAPQPGEFAYSDGSAKFSRPATLRACLAELAEHPQARLVSGGTDLVAESNLRGARFPHLISLDAVPELRVFRETDEYVEIGAGLSLNEIGSRWRGAPAAFQEWLDLFASPLIRNRATLGGNLATASPIGDAAPLLLALDAQVRIADANGERVQPLTAFFKGYRATSLRPGEVLVAVRIPKPFPALARFYKVAKRKLDDISTVACCLAIDLSSNGVVERARFAYGGVAEMPVRLFEAERAVEGRTWNPATVRKAQETAMRSVRPISDHRGSADYRVAMVQSLLGKFAYESGREAA
ncbi:MAG TPA: FAD binding domain-containing protein [Bryobacteraceae bacterium]|nr:FAD binding domain-containing protein [Bryobacteraceae bacterium]